MITLDTLRAKRTELFAMAAAHKADNLRVFGSVARGDATESSDLDLLVHFSADASLRDQIGLMNDAAKLFRTKVDVVSDESLSPFLSRRILSEAVPL